MPNQLSVKVTEANGLSFELLVDGAPLSEKLQDGNAGIPYWMVEDDLPTFPPLQKVSPNSALRIVTVCDCGEYGCGHAHCRIIKSESEVVFDQFQGDLREEHKGLRLTFSRKNYDEVTRFVVDEARRKNASFR